MRVVLRAAIGAVSIAAVLAASVTAQAAGALAVGKCAAYGYAYDYPSRSSAEQAAVSKCGAGCDKVVTISKGCAALAVDGHKPCGANGYANASKLGVAQNTALQYCYKFGGKDCVIRAWICDGKKS